MISAVSFSYTDYPYIDYFPFFFYSFRNRFNFFSLFKRYFYLRLETSFLEVLKA